jgi:hypothetical protein
MDKGRTELEVVKVFAPILLSILGAGAMLGVAATDVRDRYQWAADILVWTALPCLLASMIAVVYPFAIQRPKRAVTRHLGNLLKERKECRLFSDWVRNWAQCVDLFYALGSEETRISESWFEQASETYNSLRPWLMRHEPALPRDLVQFISDTMSARFPVLSSLDRDFESHGFYYFFRHQSLFFQFATNAESARGGRHPEHTYDGIWDGLTRYAAKRGWPAVAPWKRLTEPGVLN